MILFLDTAFNETKIVLKKDKKIYKSIISEKKNISKEIIKSLNTILVNSQSSKKDISIVYFNNGPGNFTSLRVALSCVKALAFYLNVPIIKLNSFQILALSKKDFKESYPIIVAIDAKMNEIYWQFYNDKNELFLENQNYHLSSINDFFLELKKYNFKKHYIIKNDINFLPNYKKILPNVIEAIIETKKIDFNHLISEVENHQDMLKCKIEDINLLYIRDNIAEKKK